MEPRGVPRGCELLSPLRAAPSKRSWPIASGSPGCRTCLGYTPGDLARRRSLSGRCIRDSASVVLCRQPRAGIPARGASITSATALPRPYAVTLQPGQPTNWLHDSTASTRVSGVRAILIRWKPSKPTSRSHQLRRSSDAEQQRVG